MLIDSLKKKIPYLLADLRTSIYSAVSWSRRHPVRAVACCCVMLIALEYLSLPNAGLQELERVNPRRALPS